MKLPFEALRNVTANDLRRNIRPPKIRRPVALLFGSVAFVVLALFRFVVTFAVTRSSDDANNFLAGREMASGNWRLHGWILAPDNLASTDILGQAALTAVFGPRPILMEWLEALVWAGVVTLAIVLAARRQRSQAAVIAGVATITLLGLTIQQDNPEIAFIEVISSHGSTILLALAAILLASSIEARINVTRSMLLAMVVGAGSFADPLFLVAGALPIIVTCLIRLRKTHDNRSLITIGSLTVGAVIGARLLIGINASTGGFESESLSLSFATFEDIPNHLFFALRSVTRLMGADFSGRDLTKLVTSSSGRPVAAIQPIFAGPYIFMLRAPFVVAFLAVVVKGAQRLVEDLRAWPRPNAPSRRFCFLDQLLWVSIILSASSAIVTTAVVYGLSTRFFLPAAVAGAILIARRFASNRLFAVYAVLALACSAASDIVWMAHGPWAPVIVPAPEARLIQTLENHGLEHGFAGYWEGSINTVMSSGRVNVLPLIEDVPHHLEPFSWFTNLDWYREAAAKWHGRIFFISQSTPNLPLKLSQETVIAMFGRPNTVLQSDDYTINIYDMKPGDLKPLAPAAAVPPPSIKGGPDVDAMCGSIQTLPTVARGSLDVAQVETGSDVNPGKLLVLHKRDVLVLRGWAVDNGAKAPASGMCIAVDGKMASGANVIYGQSRPDVAAAYKNPALSGTGFLLSLPAERIRPGRHSVQAAVVGASGSASLLPGSISVIGPNPEP